MTMQNAVKALHAAVPPSIWPEPDVIDSYIFLVTEVGEVGDLLMRSGHSLYKYVRNSPDEATPERLAHELGDVMLMLCTLATQLGIDLEAALAVRLAAYYAKYVVGDDNDQPTT